MSDVQKIKAAILAFHWWNYGLDGVGDADPEYSVDLAAEIASALAEAAPEQAPASTDIVTTPEIARVRDQAERIILSHAIDIESLSISEMLEDLELPEAEHEALCEQVDEAISKATVTVSWTTNDRENDA